MEDYAAAWQEECSSVAGNDVEHLVHDLPDAELQSALHCRSRGIHAAPVWAAVLPILYCLFSAIIGTQSVLLSKTLAVLLRATAGGDNQVGSAVAVRNKPVSKHQRLQQRNLTQRSSLCCQ